MMLAEISGNCRGQKEGIKLPLDFFFFFFVRGVGSDADVPLCALGSFATRCYLANEIWAALREPSG